LHIRDYKETAKTPPNGRTFALITVGERGFSHATWPVSYGQAGLEVKGLFLRGGMIEAQMIFERGPVETGTIGVAKAITCNATVSGFVPGAFCVRIQVGSDQGRKAKQTLAISDEIDF